MNALMTDTIRLHMRILNGHGWCILISTYCQIEFST